MRRALTGAAVIAALAVGSPAASAQRLDSATQLPIAGLSGSLQNPCWSPTNDRLAITNWVGGYNRGPGIVRVVDVATGALLSTLGPTDSDSVNLPGSCWDPVTNLVTFTSDPVGRDQVFVAPAIGGPAQQVTGPPQWTFELSFSPDGQWIVFESHQRSIKRGEIWKVNVNGSRLQRLTRGHDDRQPNWSPAGDRIVFQRLKRGKGLSDAWTMDTNGGGLRNVTRTKKLEETDVSWSPSGAFLVFSSDSPKIKFASLFTIPATGGARQQLTRSRNFYDGAPGWSRDGRIAFESKAGNPDGRAGTGIWTIAAPPGRQ